MFCSTACINQIRERVAEYCTYAVMVPTIRFHEFLQAEVLTKTPNSYSYMGVRVIFSEIDYLLHCECRSFEIRGLPCIHILAVLKKRKGPLEELQFKEIKNYILIDVFRPESSTDICITVNNLDTLHVVKFFMFEIF